jgi:hypothetical protein
VVLLAPFFPHDRLTAVLPNRFEWQRFCSLGSELTVFLPSWFCNNYSPS